MAPWDQASFFQPPLETTFAAINGATSVALADPQRVGLLFSAPGELAVLISTSQNVSTAKGIVIMPVEHPFVLLHSQVGNLVQQQWWAYGEGDGFDLTVVEIRLSRWPRAC
jgi:hypothetical protein